MTDYEVETTGVPFSLIAQAIAFFLDHLYEPKMKDIHLVGFDFEHEEINFYNESEEFLFNCSF